MEEPVIEPEPAPGSYQWLPEDHAAQTSLVLMQHASKTADTRSMPTERIKRKAS